jgi:PEP-CTERM motif
LPVCGGYKKIPANQHNLCRDGNFEETEMKLTSNLLLGGLAAFILALPSMASSVYTYTYTGNLFEAATGPYNTTSDAVDGSFTLSSPLGDDLSDAPFTPSSYSFTDGVQTFSSTSSPATEETFDVFTSATGAITAWTVSLAGPADANSVSTFTSEDVGMLDEGFDGEGFNLGDAGTWAETVSSGGGGSPVPEPGNVALIGLGLVGIGLVRRKLQQRNQPVA